jgi:hypothetical protein
MPGGDYNGSLTCFGSIRDAGDALNDPQRPNFVILATDAFTPAHCEGGWNVFATLSEGRDAVVSLANRGIKTFVLGFEGGALASRSPVLSDLALAGGTARAGTERYYPATSTNALGTALETINGIVTCSVRLSGRPQDPSKLSVTFDGAAITEDPMNGWTYDRGASSIVFHGSSCDRYRGGVNRATVEFGSACTPDH